MSTRIRRIAGLASAAVFVLAAGTTAIGLHELHPLTPKRPVAVATPPVDTSPPCTTGAGQPYSTNGVQQHPDGSLRACLQVGGLAPGTYTLSLQTLGTGKGAFEPPANNGGSLVLSPPYGPPGTTVTVSGYVANTTEDLRRNNHTQLCWDGCGGLADWVEIAWSTTEPGHFQTHFTVPEAPWLEAVGVHPLTPGTYTVALACLPGAVDKNQVQCPTSRPSAPFQLTGSGSSLCSARTMCGVLKPDPIEAPPGGIVTVHGWAPVVGLDGGGFLELTLGQPQPTSTKPGFVPPPILASMPFTVTAAPAWSTLGTVTPVWEQRSGFGGIAVDPSNPRRFAYCQNPILRLTTNGGGSWTTIPIAGAARVSEATDYPLVASYSGGQVPCPAVTFDPRHPSSIFATFTAAKKEWGPPPFYFLGYVTTDLGRTWRAVPVPPGLDMGSFGGFRADAQGVRALFFTDQPPDNRGFAVEQTQDGGRTWSTGSLACPSTGACVALGPQDNARCNGVMEYQGVEVSSDHGTTWATRGWPQVAAACYTTQLVGFGSNGVALIDGMNQYSVIASKDGGASWHAFSLPALPPQPDTVEGNYPGLQLLPDGSLLSAAGSWYRLAPGARSWCQVAGAPAVFWDYAAVLPQVIGDHLWWIDNTDPQTTPRLMSFPLSSVRC